MNKIFNLNNTTKFKKENNNLNKKGTVLKHVPIDENPEFEKYYVFQTWDEVNNKPAFNENKMKLKINKAWDRWYNSQELEGESVSNDCIFIKDMAVPLCVLVTKYTFKACTPISKEILILDKIHEAEYYSTSSWTLNTVRSIFYKTWLTYIPELNPKTFADKLISLMDKVFNEFRELKKL